MRRASRSPALLKTKKCGLRTSIQPTLESLAAKPAPHSKSATIAKLHQLCRAPLIIESACKRVRRAVSRLRSFSPPQILNELRPDILAAKSIQNSDPCQSALRRFLEYGHLVDPELRRAAAF